MIELQIIEYLLIAAPRAVKKIMDVPCPPIMAIWKKTTFCRIDSLCSDERRSIASTCATVNSMAPRPKVF
jgi:hypothetical protein